MKFQPYRFVGWFLFADCSPASWGRQWGYPCRWREKYEWRLVPHWSFKELGNISPKWSTFLVRCKNRSAIPHLERRIVRLIFPGFRKRWMRRLEEHEKPQLRWFLSPQFVSRAIPSSNSIIQFEQPSGTLKLKCQEHPRYLADVCVINMIISKTTRRGW